MESVIWIAQGLLAGLLAIAGGMKLDTALTAVHAYAVERSVPAKRMSD